MTMGESLVDWEYWLNDWPEHPIAVTRANAADGYPRPLTPLSQDLILTYEEAGVRRFYFDTLRVLTPADAPDPYMLACYGLVYLNADQLAGLGEATPGSSRHAMYQQFFGLEADPAYVPPQPTIADRVKEAVTGAKVAPRTLRLAKAVSAEVDRRRAEILAARPVPLDGLTGADLAAWLDRLDALQVDSWVTLMTGAGLGSGFFETVRKMLAAWAGDTTGDLCNRLHVALGGNESAEAGRAVRQLAETVRREGVESALEGDDPVGDLRRASPAATAALADLLARFGHRAPAELELSNPSWRMDPRPVLDTVRLELGREAVADEAGSIRARAEAELSSRVSRAKLPIVKAALKKSQAMMASRENGKLPAVVLWDELRRLLAAAAPRLIEQGVLPAGEATSGDTPGPSGIHFLRHQELRTVLRGGSGPGVDEIERRREAHRRCLALDLPELVEIGPGWIRPLDDAFIRARGMLPPEKLSPDATRLHGIAAAPGTVTGTARVLFDPFDEFEAGDVLFARTVDPGWAPVLACAGAVVLDIGGVLSHGAVVARELGVPCVVNVKVGTERAVNGATVTVDGSAGDVILG
jgi:phosphohistidine swiveling domain-containing protein